MEPSGVVFLQAKVAAEQEERSSDGSQRGVFDVIARLPNLECFGEQVLAHVEAIRHFSIRLCGDGGRQLEIRLYEHVGTQ